MPRGVYKRTKQMKTGLHMLNRHLSLQTREKISIAHKGKLRKPLSIETRVKISAKLKGRPVSGQRGHGQTETTRLKISASLMGVKKTPFTKEHKRKLGLVNAGRTLTKEHIKKVLTRREMSSLEVKMQNILKLNLLPYRFVGNGEFFIERKNPDFVNINGQKIAIEVYYKRHKELFKQKTIDEWKEERSAVFTTYGWKLLFFDETQVNEQNVLKVLGGDLRE